MMKFKVSILTLFLTFFALHTKAQTTLADAIAPIVHSIEIIVQMPDLTAEEIEEKITIPLENAFREFPEVDMVRSNSTLGRSSVLVLFENEIDEGLLQRIQEHLSEIELPDDAVPELILPTALTSIQEAVIQQEIPPVIMPPPHLPGRFRDVENGESNLENGTTFENDNQIDTPRARVEADEISDAFFAPAHLFRPNPRRAVMFATFFPGLGQIYNRNYWKLPIVYGGFLGFAYAISWNNGHFRDFQAAYRDLRDPNPEADSWRNFLPFGMEEPPGWFQGWLENRRDYFRHYRDMSIILSVAWYVLTIIDAYVDAQLFSFDISPDLSMRVAPTVINRGNIRNASYGFQWSFNF